MMGMFPAQVIIRKDIALEPEVSKQQKKSQLNVIGCMSHSASTSTMLVMKLLAILLHVHLLKWQLALLFCLWIPAHGHGCRAMTDACRSTQVLGFFSSNVSSSSHRPCKTRCTDDECHLPNNMTIWEWD